MKETDEMDFSLALGVVLFKMAFVVLGFSKYVENLSQIVAILIRRYFLLKNSLGQNFDSSNLVKLNVSQLLFYCSVAP